jgi:hypothetical protein
MFSNFFNFVNVTDDGNTQSMESFLQKYEGQSFLNGLYRIFRLADVPKWAEITKKSFPWHKEEMLVFGFDWLGRIFVLDKAKSVVLFFEPGTGEMLDTEVSFIDFHNNEIPIQHDACLSSSFFHNWYKANQQYVLKYNQCAGYKVPLFLNGKDELENLEVSDMEVYWEIMMPLMNI